MLTHDGELTALPEALDRFAAEVRPCASSAMICPSTITCLAFR
jgi:hypothetical protein